MRPNFTQSEAKILLEKSPQTDVQPKDRKILLFVQKIVSFIGLFFKIKDANKPNKTTSVSGLDDYFVFL